MSKLTQKEKAAVVDEYGELDRQVAGFKPVADRHKALKTEIESWYESEPADKSFEAVGKLYIVPVGEKKKERKIIDIMSLFARLGRGKFFDFCSFPLTMIEKLLPASEVPQFVRTEKSGSRTVGRAIAKLPVARPVQARKAA